MVHQIFHGEVNGTIFHSKRSVMIRTGMDTHFDPFYFGIDQAQGSWRAFELVTKQAITRPDLPVTSVPMAHGLFILCMHWILVPWPSRSQGCGPAERLRRQRPGGLLCRGPGDVVRTNWGKMGGKPVIYDGNLQILQILHGRSNIYNRYDNV